MPIPLPWTAGQMALHVVLSRVIFLSDSIGHYVCRSHFSFSSLNFKSFSMWLKQFHGRTDGHLSDIVFKTRGSWSGVLFLLSSIVARYKERLNTVRKSRIFSLKSSFVVNCSRIIDLVIFIIRSDFSTFPFFVLTPRFLWLLNKNPR